MRCNLEYNVFTFTNFTHSSSFPEVHFEIRTIRSVHITTYPYFQAYFPGLFGIQTLKGHRPLKTTICSSIVWPRLVVASAFCSKLVMHIANWSQSVPLSSIRPGLFSIKAQTSRQSLKSISSHRSVEERLEFQRWRMGSIQALYTLTRSSSPNQAYMYNVHVCKQFRIRCFLPPLFVTRRPSSFVQYISQ